MKLNILFAFLFYYGLLSLFFFFANPYLGEGYTINVDVADLDIDYRTGYHDLQLFYSDFHWSQGGTVGWSSTPIGGWTIAFGHGSCASNDCYRSSHPSALLSYKVLDTSMCLEGIRLEAFVNGIDLNASSILHLWASSNGGLNYTAIDVVSSNGFTGVWAYTIEDDVYMTDNFRFGFRTEGLSGSQYFFVDDVEGRCYVTQRYLEDAATQPTAVSIRDFFAFVGFGVGLPVDTPLWFRVMFIIWQSLILVVFFGFLYQAIRGS